MGMRCDSLLKTAASNRLIGGTTIDAGPVCRAFVNALRLQARLSSAKHTCLAANVFGFTKAREPTARAAKGFPPPFTEATFPRLRWQALRSNALREPGVR
jgi:hypothetical protein